jgi:hypothetical protein
MKAVYFLISLFAAWVFYDAQKRGKGTIVAFLWCLGTQLIPIIFLPLWLTKRPEQYQNIVRY